MQHPGTVWAADGEGFSALRHGHGNAAGTGHPQAGRNSRTQSSSHVTDPVRLFSGCKKKPQQKGPDIIPAELRTSSVLLEQV